MEESRILKAVPEIEGLCKYALQCFNDPNDGGTDKDIIRAIVDRGREKLGDFADKHNLRVAKGFPCLDMAVDFFQAAYRGDKDKGEPSYGWITDVIPEWDTIPSIWKQWDVVYLLAGITAEKIKWYEKSSGWEIPDAIVNEQETPDSDAAQQTEPGAIAE